MKKLFLVALLTGAPGIACATTDSKAVAQMAGAMIAEAEACKLSTQPIESAINIWFDRQGISPSERQRLNGEMTQVRQALTGFTPVGGCEETKRRIDRYYANINR